VTTTLGEKLQPVIDYLCNEVSEALVAKLERSPALILEILIATLQLQTENFALQFFKVLKLALPEGANKRDVMEIIAKSLVRKAPEHQERFAEAIIIVVSYFVSLFFFVLWKDGFFNHSSRHFINTEGSKF
jgi:hypothetical protein